MSPENDILRTVTPDVHSLVWVDDKNLSLETPFFSTIDYLLDGLARKHLDHQSDWSQVTFAHNIFGKNFWVIFANTKVTKLEPLIHSLKSIIPETSRSKMIVLNHEILPESWNSSLDKLFGFVERL